MPMLNAKRKTFSKTTPPQKIHMKASENHRLCMLSFQESPKPQANMPILLRSKEHMSTFQPKFAINFTKKKETFMRKKETKFKNNKKQFLNYCNALYFEETRNLLMSKIVH